MQFPPRNEPEAQSGWSRFVETTLQGFSSRVEALKRNVQQLRTASDKTASLNSQYEALERKTQTLFTTQYMYQNYEGSETTDNAIFFVNRLYDFIDIPLSKLRFRNTQFTVGFGIQASEPAVGSAGGYVSPRIALVIAENPYVTSYSTANILLMQEANLGNGGAESDGTTLRRIDNLTINYELTAQTIEDYLAAFPNAKSLTVRFDSALLSGTYNSSRRLYRIAQVSQEAR